MEGGRGGGWVRKRAFAERVPRPSPQLFLLPASAPLSTTPVTAPSQGQVSLALRGLSFPVACLPSSHTGTEDPP